jgi:RNA polymerase sigma factor (sigma-70 family)
LDGRQIESSLLRLAENRNDEEAWTALYVRFRPFVYAVAYRRTNGSQDLVQEAVQETFFRLVKYCPFHKLTDADDFRRYLAVVTRNVVTILRRHEPYPQKGRGLLGTPEAELGEPILTPHGETVELRQLLQRALKELPREERRALALSLNGYSLQEIAGRLGISTDNAAVRLHRIRAKLRRNPTLKDLL